MSGEQPSVADAPVTCCFHMRTPQRRAAQCSMLGPCSACLPASHAAAASPTPIAHLAGLPVRQLALRALHLLRALHILVLRRLEAIQRGAVALQLGAQLLSLSLWVGRERAAGVVGE